jgi:hypothetical protein
MQRFAWIIALALAAMPLRLPADSGLLARMQALNPDLHSFQATMNAHIALTTFPFLATNIVATYYHKNPDMDRVVVHSGVPAMAQNFTNLIGHIEPASQWERLYVVTPGRDDGKTATFTLVPRAQGNVTRIVAKVDDATATVSSMSWEYANGGSATMSLEYRQIDGNMVVASQNGQVQEPQYSGSITATLSNYVMNPQLPDSMFTQ